MSDKAQQRPCQCQRTFRHPQHPHPIQYIQNDRRRGCLLSSSQSRGDS
ncbi:MAG: hypothetical protein IPL28_00510 [Chloroflexi bacterium]|nr:hypothetical protein [Chloroflexota bacterium]